MPAAPWWIGERVQVTTTSPGRTEVALRPVRVADSDALFHWINNRVLVSLSAAFRPVTRAQHDTWFAGILAADATRSFFMIERSSDGLAVGSCQLLSIHPVHRSAILQIRLGESFARDQGYGTEAVMQLVRFGFDRLGLHRIGLEVFATNMRAMRAYEKAGFVVEGRLQEAAWIEGKFVDIICMGLLNDRP